MTTKLKDFKKHKKFHYASQRFTTGSCGVLALELFNYFNKYNFNICQFQGHGEHTVLSCNNQVFGVDIFGIELLDDKIEFHRKTGYSRNNKLDIHFLDINNINDYKKLLNYTRKYGELLPSNLEDFSPDEETKYWAEIIFNDSKEKYPELFDKN